MKVVKKLCPLVTITLLLIIFRETVQAQGSNEQIESCSLRTDNSNHDGRSCYSEVDAAIYLGNDTHFEDALQNILIERYIGSPGHDKVAEYIKSSLSQLGWQIESDKFQAPTPLGTKSFENIVAKLNPRASKVVALACHYESKYFSEFTFLAATDSAVPCAMMLNLANTLRRQLDKLKQADYSLDLIFFDGEEAFREWSDNDSIYGSRHLAAKMQKDRSIQRMKLLVLLDLLGAPAPVFQSHFSNTDNEHKLLVQIEGKLRSSNKIQGRTFIYQGQPLRYFQEVPYGFSRRAHITIEDDHVPFFRRGVRVLHIIPTPFPQDWHKETDNLQALDMATIHDLNVILRAFILRTFYDDITQTDFDGKLDYSKVFWMGIVLLSIALLLLMIYKVRIHRKEKKRKVQVKKL